MVQWWTLNHEVNMKLSKETLALLKNFSMININLLLVPGNTLSTKSSKKTIAATAQVPETFDTEFGIYDLPEFLGALSLFESPIIEFGDKFATITEEENVAHSIRFYNAERSLLVYLEDGVKYPDTYIDFDLSIEEYTATLKAASILKSDIIKFVGEDGNLYIQTGKEKQEANMYRSLIGSTDRNFTAVMMTEHFKMLPKSYRVSLTSRGISRFKDQNSELTYYMAIDATKSRFN